MIRTKVFLAIMLALAACTTSREQLFLAMSDQELAAHNEELPEGKQIVCSEGVRRGTAGLLRKICTNKARMERLTQRAGADDYAFVNGLNDPGFNRNMPDDRSVLPRIYFSPSPPGYDRPVIHVLDPQ